MGKNKQYEFTCGDVDTFYMTLQFLPFSDVYVVMRCVCKNFNIRIKKFVHNYVELIIYQERFKLLSHCHVEFKFPRKVTFVWMKISKQLWDVICGLDDRILSFINCIANSQKASPDRV